MNQALLNKKLKDSFGETRFKPSEDSLTSSTIGLLQYLGGTLFWDLLRNSCGETHLLPEKVGELLEVYFWRRFLPDLEYNVNHVEPDVYCEFENYNLIIEAKKGDAFGQDEIQWRKEINSYYKEVESNKPLLFIAIGGNHSLKVKSIGLDKNGSIQTIYGASWQRLLGVCIAFVKEDTLSKADKRILNDVINLFDKHHFYNISWLKFLSIKSLGSSNLKVLEIWNEKDSFQSKNADLLMGLAPILQLKVNSFNTISSWKIIQKNLKKP
ncbi:hypothetical protein [Sphingobacterium siyangense]|uniref:hypothetical protein n=1 Tax=Sphingobacterium siyangense TaxID=459529 RepID=UPI001962D855|nr:hypothetical protein [Sphingobacterium siyangense]QRY60525.1 hypothetical protein JVX97_14180 [Sphingobacterium siyangense]